VSFCRTVLACILHGSAATQLRGGGRFYSEYVCLLFPVVMVKKYIKIGQQKPKLLQI